MTGRVSPQLTLVNFESATHDDEVIGNEMVLIPVRAAAARLFKAAPATKSFAGATHRFAFSTEATEAATAALRMVRHASQELSCNCMSFPPCCVRVAERKCTYVSAD